MKLILLFKILFILIFSSLATRILGFNPLKWDDLIYQMEKRMSWQVARMETVVQVFNPLANNLDDKLQANTSELLDRRFKQIIHWKDGEVLVVETLNEKDELLHFYYEKNGDILSISLSEKRIFVTEDILPRQLRFKSRYFEDRSRALEEFGIFSKEVKYHIREDNRVFLLVGNFESGHYALINPKNYELSSMHSKIWKGNGNWSELKIVFKNYEKYRWQSYAVITEYFLDEKLFKRVTVSKIRTLSALPLKILRKKALDLSYLESTTLENDYAL